jgi:ankyrin repeat protein
MVLPARSLPPRPSLDWLRKTAKDHLRVLRGTRPGAKLAQAQRDVARQYGFRSWRALKAHVDGLALVGADAVTGPFLERVGVGDLDAVRTALTADPGLVNAVGPHPFWGGRPQPLHVAVETCRRPMVDLLLDAGAEVDGRNAGYDHWSPLALAVDRSRPDLQRVLLDRGAQVGLLEALLLGDDPAVARLLSGGRAAVPDIAPNGGSLLAFARTRAAIDRLLELGADRDRRDRWGTSPMEAMSRLGPAGQPLVRHLVARGLAAAPAEYARLGDQATLAALTERDPAVARSAAVLLGAVDFGHHELAQWLLDHGADPGSRSAAGSQGTALHSAAWEGDLRMARLLVAAGADPAARDAEHGTTPARWARVALEVTGNERCAEVAEFLDSRPDPAPS